MKKFSLWMTAFVAVAGLLVAVNTASAQQNQPAASGHQVGLIDMAHIFKNYEKFKAETQALQAAAEQAEAKAKDMVAQMQAKQSRMQDLTAGSPDYNKLEGEIIQLQTQLQAFQQVERRDIVRKQADVYKKIYVEVQGAVEQYAKYYNYTLIMRFNREDVAEATDAQKIIQSMNRQVVWYRTQDDLTDPILQFLNDQYKKTASR